MNPTLETLHGLRSIHGAFTEQSVPEETISAILEASLRAANASNRQSYSIIVVDDREAMGELTGYKASHALIYCVDYNRVIAAAEHTANEFTVHGMPELISGAIDASLAAQTAAIAARALGVESLFTNGIHRGNPQRLFDILRIPETYCFPLVALLLGYAAEEPKHLHGRLKGPGVIHRGVYRHALPDELDEIVSQYDDPEAHIAAGFPWRDKGFEHYLDWFYQVWSKRFPQEPGPSSTWRLLERTGFLEIDEY
ncbi:nitroreductase family protein [Candidatus Bipolaricaulota bacterium]